MSGGTLRHNRIALNAAALLLARLAGKPCQVYMSDVKLHVARDSAYYYPDVMVACSDQAGQQVEIYRRSDEIGWLYITYEPGDTVEFASVGMTLPITDLYAGTDILNP